MTQDRGQQWRAEQAGSFGAVAGDYAAARPSYPQEAVAWLAGPPPRDVVDLGAGTGKLTELLVAAGHRVRAVDSSAGMLGELHARLPEVATLEGSAEAVPLPDGSADVVTAAQAWHWFDQEAAPVECARLLRPGGQLAPVWNERDESVDWVAAVWAPLHRTGRTGIGLLPQGWQDAVARHAPFAGPEHRIFRYEQTLTRDGVLRLVASRSAVAVMDDAGRTAILAEVAEVLDTHPDTRGRAELTLPYETRCWRWERR